MPTKITSDRMESGSRPEKGSGEVGGILNVDSTDQSGNGSLLSTPTRPLSLNRDSSSIFDDKEADIHAIQDAFDLFDKTQHKQGAMCLGSQGQKKKGQHVQSYNYMRLRRTKEDATKEEVYNESILKDLSAMPSLSADMEVQNERRGWQQLVSDHDFVNNVSIIVQIVLNAIVFCVVLGLSIAVCVGIKRDADRKVAKHVSEIIYEINSCKRDYLLNNCSPEMRVPVLEKTCMELHNCMQRDPESVITSVAYFEVLADCMNAFFQNLTFRAMGGITVTFFVCVVLPNMLLLKVRTPTTTINKTYTTKFDKRLKATTNGASLTTPASSNSIVRFDPNVSYSFYDDNE